MNKVITEINLAIVIILDIRIIYLCVCVSVYEHMYHGAHVTIREQPLSSQHPVFLV